MGKHTFTPFTHSHSCLFARWPLDHGHAKDATELFLCDGKHLAKMLAFIVED